ncbi:ammonium transporter [Thermodesulfatator autotrophicus]|uniref:Ammonium transporter n=1 Tax=Thermodesulfatator autotrophicus TaxID=1795632 RepID=A0A177E6Z2_9BACT|nr:ammonium transporter [Thermodesulfatator autotrophicus]OAG27210.1 ammonia channel protein [Thermodesulfatator autotrophicus]
MNQADIAFMLISSALVMFMTPGLALFYGGLVRSKNVLSIMMQCFICLGLVSLIWFLYGYSLAFGNDIGKIIGDFSYLFFKNVNLDPGPPADNIPHLLFATFQLMFAIITPALITGAFAERMRFSSFLIFIFLWVTFVYLPLCHWVWGGGWIGSMGALDFAGGTVIHIASGASALAAALVVGARKGYRQAAFHPHNLPISILGAAILWFGWFGFNAGSALAADRIAVLAFANTQLAAGLAAFAWIVAEWIHQGKPTTLGAISGAVAGLVAITPAAGFVPPWASIIIGILAGVICYLAVLLKVRLGYDDSLDVVGIHGVGGFLGAVLTGVFCFTSANPGGADGLLAGNVQQFIVQVIGAGASVIYCFVLSFILLKLVDVIFGLRVSPEEEVQGLDLSDHGEKAYNL